MAKRNTRPPQHRNDDENDGDENGQPFDGDAATRAENAMARVFAARDESGGGEDWSVYVTRLSGPDKKDGRLENRLFQKPVDDLPYINTYLADEYGEGVYRIRVRRDRSIFQQWDVCIELSPTQKAAFRDKLRALNDPYGVRAPAAAGAERAGDPIMAFIAQQAEINRAILERLANPPAPANPIDTFAGVATAFKTFQDLMPKPEVSTGVDMFNKGMELAKEILADREAPSQRTGIMDLARDAMNNPSIGEAVGAFLQTLRQPQPANPPPQRRELPPPARAPMAPQPAKVQQPAAAHTLGAGTPAPEEPSAAMMQQAIDYLCNKAKEGVQPQLFTEQALGMIPNGLMEELEAADDMLALLVARFPQIEPHQLWFEALLGDMFPPIEEGEPSADAPGDQEPEPAAVAP